LKAKNIKANDIALINAAQGTRKTGEWYRSIQISY
jgi:hypothetical protein